MSTELKFTLLASEWGSKHGGLSTLNRVFAIELAKHSKVHVSVFVPRCDQEEIDEARKNSITLVKATRRPGFDEKDWLCYPPDHLQIDIVIGHGVILGRQAQIIREKRGCKWIQFVHTDPEELGMFKRYSDPIAKGETKHGTEVELCEMADSVVAMGPKLAEAYRSYLRSSKKDQQVFDLTPGIFSEFSDVEQATQEGNRCQVLAFGRGDSEDFSLKGYDIAAKAVGKLENAILIFVGACNKQQDDVADNLKQCGIPPERLRVRSYRESRQHLKSLLCEVDLAIMPSRTEGFGLAALEALSAGLPILASGNSGFGKALSKVTFGSGCVIHSDDPMVWAEEIKKVWKKDRETRLDESDTLRICYAKKYNWETQCNDLVEIARSMVTGEPARKLSSGSGSQDPGQASHVSAESAGANTNLQCGPVMEKHLGTQSSSTQVPHLEVTTGVRAGSVVPPEIRARGRGAEVAFQKAMQNGKVHVYRGRIMLLGQEGAGKTSLKNSLLGIRFDPREESTVGVEVYPSKCEVDVDQVKNWQRTEQKKLDVSEHNDDIARIIAKDLTETDVNQRNIEDVDSLLEQGNGDKVDAGSPKKSDASPTLAKSTPDTKRKKNTEIDDPSTSDSTLERSEPADQDIQSSTVPIAVTELVVHYLQQMNLEDDIKAKEAILTLWDFAGQHLYYASHSVFLSQRAVYTLVYNLSKDLNAPAEPCVRQGIHDIVLENHNNETNLESLLSWLASVHSIRPTADEAGSNHQGKLLDYLRPPVFIVGTNADRPFKDAKKMEKCIETSISDKTYVQHVIRPLFAVDNTRKLSEDGVQALQKRVMEVLKEEPYMGEEVPIRWFKFEKIVEALVAKETYHMDLDQLLTVTRQVCRIDDKEELTAMLNFYHDLGVIVKYGHTVVLQAQWLIDLFKQLITVRPFDKVDPLFSECWNELEKSGILSMTLVDHVFANFIRKGNSMEDILDMMELYGLIVKFSFLPAVGEHEQRYFVPAQLRSSPSGLCKIKPSKGCDPCPLYLDFLDGFVPHGLFPQLLSRCIRWCSDHGTGKAPNLYQNGARLFIGKQTTSDLILICKKRFIKIMLKQRNYSVPAFTASAKMARKLIEDTLQDLSRELSWFRNLRYKLCVACTSCEKDGEECVKHGSVRCTDDDCLHLLPVVPEEQLICRKSFSYETIHVCGLEKWFQGHKMEIEEQKVAYLAPEGYLAVKYCDVCRDAYQEGSKSRKGKEASLGEKRPHIPSKSYTDGPAQRTRRRSSTQDTHPKVTTGVREGTPSEEELEKLSLSLGDSWEKLARRLEFKRADLTEFRHNIGDDFTKAPLRMLNRWKEKMGTDHATWEVLHAALCHELVQRRDLAEEFCQATQ